MLLTADMIKAYVPSGTDSAEDQMMARLLEQGTTKFHVDFETDISREKQCRAVIHLLDLIDRGEFERIESFDDSRRTGTP